MFEATLVAGWGDMDYKARKGALAASVTSTAGGLGLAARKLVAPPPALAALLRDLERSGDFAILG